MLFFKKIIKKILPKKNIEQLSYFYQVSLYYFYRPLRILESKKKNVLSNGIKLTNNQKLINCWFFIFQRPVSIIIPSYNDYNYLKQCLDSIFQTVKTKIEVVIVDDYCQQKSRDELKKLESKKVRVIYRKQNGGFSKAINTGIKNANKNNDIIILNSDTVCLKNWFQNLMYGAYKIDKKVGVCAPKLIFPDKTIQSAGSYRYQYAGFNHYYKDEPEDLLMSQIPQYCLAATGACLYIKRELIDKIGVLSEDYKFTYEDIDYCVRTWDVDQRVLYFPLSKIVHYEGKTRKKNKNTDKNIQYSMDFFWNKWNQWFDLRKIKDSINKYNLIFVITKPLQKEIMKKIENKNLNYSFWCLKGNIKPNKDLTNQNYRFFNNNQQMLNELSCQKAIKISLDWRTNYLVLAGSFKNGRAVYLVNNFDQLVDQEPDPKTKNLILSSNRQELINVSFNNFNQDFLSSLEQF